MDTLDETAGVSISSETLQRAGLLTTAQEDSIKVVADSCQAIIMNVLNNFVRYHIQDGSVYLGGEQNSIVYETAAYDDETSLFRRLTVENQGSAINVKDARGVTAHVVVGDHSNQVSRQCVFTKSNRWLYTASYVVIHQIDDVLLYSNDQLLPDGFIHPTYPAPSEVKRY